MENGVVTVLYFFRKRGYPLKSLHDFWDTLVYEKSSTQHIFIQLLTAADIWKQWGLRRPLFSFTICLLTFCVTIFCLAGD